MTATAGDYPHADTTAARMLLSGLRRISDESGTSIRQLAKQLGYKQAVVLSHMASGRVPIPIDRAPELAKALDLPERAFVRAVLEQRHPDVDWAMFAEDAADGLESDLRMIAGVDLGELSREHSRVVREAVAEPHPARRWLTVHELPIVEMLRELRPAISVDGLSSSDRRAIRHSLANH